MGGGIIFPPGSAVRRAAELVSLAPTASWGTPGRSWADADSQHGDVTILPEVPAQWRRDPFFSFAAAVPAEEAPAEPRAAAAAVAAAGTPERGPPDWGRAERRDEKNIATARVARGDCVDMSRYLQESPPQLPGPLGAGPLPARPDKPPTISREADRDRKVRDSVRELQPGRSDEEGLSNPCLNLQQKLLGIRCVGGAAGTPEAPVGAEDGCPASDDAAALAYKRRSFADMYHL